MNIKRIVLIRLLPVLMICLIMPVWASGGRVLNIKDLRVAPNPFSPYSEYAGTNGGQGLRVRFEVETLSRFFWYTIRVHNIEGNVVRTIVDELTPEYVDYDKLEPPEIVVWWDGKDDSGRMANNGRYIIYLKVSDTEAQTFSTEAIRAVVLIK